MSSFLYYGAYHIVAQSESIVKVNISCPDQFQTAKNLLIAEHIKAGRYDPKEHLNMLQKSGSLADPQNPMLVCGIRNVMSNYRCIVYTEGNVSPDQKPPYSVHGENPLQSQRPYFAMAYDSEAEKVVLEEYLPSKGDLKRFRWLFSGVPVVWDDFSEDKLFQKILVEASDHSHVYVLPRGNHPEATDETRSAWEEMHNVFIDTLYESSEIAFHKLHAIAKRLGLKREDDYVHSLMGVDDDGNILTLMRRGKLEDLGSEIRRQGAKRAICVENSGSITLLYYREGISGPEVSFFATPNQRRLGTAFLVIEMKDKSFGNLKY